MISGNRIYENSAYYNGGGISCEFNSNPLIINNVVSFNYAHYGGGIDIIDSSPTVINSIFWGDSSSSRTYDEIYVSGGSPSFLYCDIQDTVWEGIGNISIDPLFRGPEYGVFHLMSTACGDPYESPCIDAGHPDILDSLLDCSWGLGELRSDMGAYGGGDSVMVGIETQEPPMPDRFILSQNYPNPFNAVTVIRYALPEPADVRIEIYDILGRRVEKVTDEWQPAGYHEVIWDGGMHASGAYFYRIQAGDYDETKKMVLLK